MTTYRFVGVPVFNPFTRQWAGVLKVRKYDPYVPLLDDGDETADQIVIRHAVDKLGAVWAMEQAIQEQIPAACRECGLDKPPCWKQIPPFEFWLSDEVCPLFSR